MLLSFRLTPLCLLLPLIACGDSPSSAASDAGTSGASTEGEEAGTGSTEGDDAPLECGPDMMLQGPAGDVFIDGVFTGISAPTPINFPPGTYTLGVGTDEGYYRREVTSVAGGPACDLNLDQADLQAPRTWTALYVDIPSLRGVENGCLIEPSSAELDAVYQHFLDNAQGLAEVGSYRTMSWEVTRVQTAGTVDIASGGGDYTLRPDDLGSVFDDLEVGEYDLIVTGWKAQGDGCALTAGYVGLGWTPQPETKQMGFANLRIEAGDMVAHVQNLDANDPGGFLHEWLHTVEFYYQDQGANMPNPAGGFPLHAAGDYGYNFPWLLWYDDFMRGKVWDASSSSFRGITPDQLLRCTLKDAVADPDNCG